MSKLTLLPLALLLSPLALAQPTLPAAPSVARAPSMVVSVDNKTKRSLGVSQVKANVRIVGHLAETLVTITFHNPHDRILEGDLFVPLPEGSVISSYALDVAGVMVPGVVVAKDAARQIFEEEVRKGVDPGLVEWSGGNSFTTRVFPIPAKGSRTVRVGWVSELAAGEDGPEYRLPLAFPDPVGTFALRIAVEGHSSPSLVSGGPSGLAFQPKAGGFVAERTAHKIALKRDLRVRLGGHLPERSVLVEEAPDGKVYFALRAAVTPPAPTGDAVPIRRVAVFWDASRSRAGSERQKELQTLERFMDRLGQREVALDLVFVRDRATAPLHLRLPAQRAEVLEAIRSVDYDGGTQLGVMRTSTGDSRPDLALVFSDGVSSFGREQPRGLSVPTWTVSASTVANHAFLRYLGLRNGGGYYNLASLTPEQAAEGIGRAAFSVVSTDVKGAPTAAFLPRVRGAIQSTVTFAGRLTEAEATVRIGLGRGTRATDVLSFVVRRSDAVKGDLLRRYWAQKKVDDLLVFPERNSAELTRVGQRHGLVTPGTSLLVLETLAQYVQHNVRPPSALPTLRATFDAAKRGKALAAKKDKTKRLRKVLRRWKKRVAWWNKRFQPKTKKKKRVRGRTLGARRSRSVRLGAGRMMLRGTGSGGGGRARVISRSRRVSIGSVGGRARATLKIKKPSTVRRPKPSIALKSWDPKTPYLRALRRAAPAKRWSVYKKQRAIFGASPAFFLDCAGFFHEKAKRPDLGLQVLSNLAELELESPPLLRVLAYRLQQTGHLDLAVRTLERVAKLRPEEPQSHRDLALALARRAEMAPAQSKQARRDLGRAMKGLSRVVMGTWSRFKDIEIIALTELNNLIPTARLAGLNALPIDKRLVKHLDVDVRIVLSWDADLTDMDLHVIEPGGEEAYYSHNRTAIGGMVTRDYTRGYGPEVYLLRRAKRGTYTIKAKYYGSSAVKLAGAVTVRVDVYTRYGRKDQKHRSLTVRLKKKKDTFTIGKIRI